MKNHPNKRREAAIEMRFLPEALIALGITTAIPALLLALLG